MVRLSNNESFLTHKSNFPQLIEFSNTFNVEIIPVTVMKKSQIFELKEIPEIICSDQKIDPPNVKVSSSTNPRKKRVRKNEIQQAQLIRGYILEQFMHGKTVELNSIREKYSNLDLTCSAFSNHIRVVKAELIKNGYKIEKVKSGNYRINF